MRKIFVRIKMWLTGEYIVKSNGIDVRDIKAYFFQDKEMEIRIVLANGHSLTIDWSSDRGGYINLCNEVVRKHMEWHTGDNSYKRSD